MIRSNFKYRLLQEVRVSPTETGKVIARAEYYNAESSYQVRYTAGDGRKVEQWWAEDALSA